MTFAKYALNELNTINLCAEFIALKRGMLYTHIYRHLRAPLTEHEKLQSLVVIFRKIYFDVVLGNLIKLFRDY